MIYLDTTTRKLQAVLAGAVAANQPKVSVFFYDVLPQSSSSVRRGAPQISTLNSTTDVDICDSPVLQGIIRNIHTIFVYNKDTAAVTVTVKIDDAGTETELVKQIVAVGSSLIYEDQRGWQGIDPLTLPVSDATEVIKGSGDESKRLRFEVDGLTAGATRVLTMPDTNVTLFAAGTVMIFQQTNAPTGWTKSSAHNDKALRIVSGAASSGGATAFTTVFGTPKTTGSHQLSVAEMPAHAHAASTVSIKDDGATGGSSSAIGGPAPDNTLALTITSEGGDGGHTHTLSLDLHYVDVIAATKD